MTERVAKDGKKIFGPRPTLEEVNARLKKDGFLNNRKDFRIGLPLASLRLIEPSAGAVSCWIECWSVALAHMDSPEWFEELIYTYRRDGKVRLHIVKKGDGNMVADEEA